VSDDRRLRDKLAKLASADGDIGPRRLAPGPDGDLVRRVLDEIDETILARGLTFRADHDSALGMEVANRRLLRLTALPDDLVDDEAAPALLSPIAADDEHALALVAETIHRFAAGRQGLSVETVPLTHPAERGAVGRSAAALAQALGIDLYADPAPEEPSPDPAGGFLPGLATLALALSEIEDGMPSPATGPYPDAVARLSAIRRDAVAGLLAELGAAPQRPGRFLLMQGETHALFVGQDDSSRAVCALLPITRAGAVVALWRATRTTAR
jgi:hypothetical protein